MAARSSARIPEVFFILIIMLLINSCISVETVRSSNNDKKIISRNASEDEIKAMNVAIKANTIEAFKEFLARYPNSSQAEKIEKHLKYLIAREEFNKAYEINTIEAYEAFLKKYSIYDEKSTQAAHHNIEVIKHNEEVNSYNAAIKENTIDGYDQYLKMYPSGKYSGNARNKIISIRLAEEEKYFDAAKRTYTIESLTDYLEKYPNGIYINDIAAMLNDIRQEQKQKEEAEIEIKNKEAYEAAYEQNTVSALENFILNHVDPTYIKMAKERIDFLNKISELESKYKTAIRTDFENYRLSNPYGFIEKGIYAFSSVHVFQWLNIGEILATTYIYKNAPFHILLGPVDPSMIDAKLNDVIAIYRGAYEYDSTTAHKIVPSFEILEINSGLFTHDQ